MAETLAAPAGLDCVIRGFVAYLSWDGVYGAASYSIRYKTTSDSSWTTVSSSVPAISFTPAASATYSWQVMAIGDGSTFLDSPWSDAGSFTTSERGSLTITTSQSWLMANSGGSNYVSATTTGTLTGFTWKIGDNVISTNTTLTLYVRDNGTSGGYRVTAEARNVETNRIANALVYVQAQVYVPVSPNF